MKELLFDITAHLAIMLPVGAILYIMLKSKIKDKK